MKSEEYEVRIIMKQMQSQALIRSLALLFILSSSFFILNSSLLTPTCEAQTASKYDFYRYLQQYAVSIDPLGEILGRVSAQFEERLGVDFDLKVKVGNLRFAFKQALGDNRTHGAEFLNAFLGDRTAGIDGRTAGNASVGRGVEDVFLDDASAGAGPGEGGEIDTFSLGDFLRERGCFDAGTVRRRISISLPRD